MHLYCDESGGTDGELFCVSALRLDAREAERALRSFRKSTGRTGEVKGHGLDGEERRLLLDLTFRAPGTAAVVMCDSRTALGGWAAKTLAPEASLRYELLTEACTVALAGAPPWACQGVIIDGGRYQEKVLREERQRLEGALRTRGLLTVAPHPRLITHTASEAHAGLQLTDVVANTIHRLVRDGEPGHGPDFSGLPDVLTGRLAVRHVALAEQRPPWVGEPPY